VSKYLMEFLTSPEMQVVILIWFALSAGTLLVIIAALQVGNMQMNGKHPQPQYRLRLIKGEWNIEVKAPHLHSRGWILCEGPFPDHQEAIRALDKYRGN